MQVKLCFCSSFFRFFPDHWRDLFSPHAGSSNPHLHCASPLKPCKSHHCHCLICGHVSKYMFFSFLFFHSFFDQCYRDPLYPTRQALNPLPLHHIILTPITPPSSLPPPHLPSLLPPIN